MDNFNFAQQGWQCPICKRVYSPFTPCCFSCGAEGRTYTSTGTGVTDIDWQKHTTAVHKPQEDNYTSISTGYATYTAEDIRICSYCKHHNVSDPFPRVCRECINHDKWEKK